MSNAVEVMEDEDEEVITMSLMAVTRAGEHNPLSQERR